MESVPKRKLPQYNPSVTSAFAAAGGGSQPLATAPSRRGNVINLRLDREHHKVFRQAFFQKGLPPEAYRKLKLMTLRLGLAFFNALRANYTFS